MCDDTRDPTPGDTRDPTPRPAARPGGFTLVELLVVIGIIALLISILLPSLNRARQQANLIDCQARLRSIGQGVQLYANANRGLLPWGWVQNNAAGLPATFNKETIWWVPVSVILGADEKLANEGTADGGYKGLSRVFVDKDTAQVESNGGVPAHYTSNSRLMPYYNIPGDATGKPGGTVSQQVKQSNVRNSSECALIWDGMQILDWKGGSAWPRSDHMDGFRVGFYEWYGLQAPADQLASYGGWAADNYLLPASPGADGAPANRSKAAQKRFNVDSSLASGFFTTALRFRHVNNTSMNMLFVDGHVESRKVGEVLARDVSARMKVPS